MTNFLKDKLSLREQNNILAFCVKNETPLGEELAKRGLTYEALRYVDYPDIPYSDGRSELFDEIGKMTSSIPAVSFFSGAGGLDVGFERAGFHHLASIESNEIFCSTLRLNYPNGKIIGPPENCGDMRNRTNIVSELEKIIGNTKPFDGVFHGGPPCQPFSIASNQRFNKNSSQFKRQGFSDKEKGALLFDYLWLISHFRPSVFLIENVAGISLCDDDNRFKTAMDELSSRGYTISHPFILNAAHYGVPQNRIRWIMIGNRVGADIAPPKPSVYAASCYDSFNRSMFGVENHQTREHTADSVSRYMVLQYGSRDKMGRVDRLNPYLPSKTVIAGGTKGGGRSHLHPYVPRTLSVRECARLQTFPDNYIFSGSTARQFTQVGNAVPPLLAYKIAREIGKILVNNTSKMLIKTN